MLRKEMFLNLKKNMIMVSQRKLRALGVARAMKIPLSFYFLPSLVYPLFHFVFYKFLTLYHLNYIPTCITAHYNQLSYSNTNFLCSCSII